MALIQFGGYIDPWKTLAIVVILLAWARTLTWIDKDTNTARLKRVAVNSGMIGGLILGYLLFFLLPGFILAFSVLVFLFLADIGTYLGIRYHVVGLDDLKEQFKVAWEKKFKKADGKVEEVAGQVVIAEKSGAPRPIPASDSPELPRYLAAQALLHIPLKYGAERLELINGDPSTVRYTVDGVSYESDPMERGQAANAIYFLKQAAGMDTSDRRKPQTGIFRTTLDKNRRVAQITTQGSTAGESAKLIFDPTSRLEMTLDSLGLYPDQLELLQNFIGGGGGVVMLAAPKGQGLTTLAYSLIRSHDAFLNHVHTIERAPEMELEGITQNAIPAMAPPGEEARQVEWVLSQEPDVIMLPSLEEAQSATMLSKYATESRRVYVGLRAGGTLDAIRQWRRLVGDDVLATRNLSLVISVRLMRRLCSACKVAYAPDPNQLRKLNMDVNEVGKLYLARKEPMRDAKGRVVPCPFCNDLGFKGRFGVYEIFAIDEEARKVLATGGTDNQLKQLFRKMKGRFLQEVALQRVQEGETSLEEVLRVLKSESTTGSSAGNPTRVGGPPAANNPRAAALERTKSANAPTRNPGGSRMPPPQQ